VEFQHEKIKREKIKSESIRTEGMNKSSYKINIPDVKSTNFLKNK